MNTIIGVDTHISTCDYCAISNDGSLISSGRFSTSALEFRRNLSQIDGKNKVLVIEQGPLSHWIRRISRGYVEKVVVAEPRRNRWISRDSVKDDVFDAEKLAHLYRGGFIQEIVPREEQNEEILRLVLQHHDVTRQMTQVKNKIKAKFRQNGIRAAGTRVYLEENRKEWLFQLSPTPALKYSTEQYFAQLDLLKSQIKETDKRISEVSRKYPAVQLLRKKFPGIGLINGATFVALIDTPERFSTVKKLWTYCGLGIDIRHSGTGRPMARLTYRGNKLLKHTLKSAINTALRVSKENVYKKDFEKRILDGYPEYKAVLACTRKLAKDMWLAWRETLKT